ncbi:DUF3857 domain-containing protein [Mucilaginibacter sp.]|uniref:DUF3857 domain-containing protein n=1 Tax=Mucilaginibacter sp. TaxID=1882438 RepID=UPI0035BBC4EC
MRALYICLFSCMLALTAGAQGLYNANLIPQELLPYASAVMRNNEVTLEVKDPDNTIYHVKTAITVLNKNGVDIAHIILWHNRTNLIRYVKGMVYNEFGQATGKFTEKEFSDVNATSQMSLFEDSRVKHYVPSNGSYPYTIEYEYEIRSKQSLNFKDWQPNEHLGLAVEKSTFNFICKPDFKIRYKEINMPQGVTIGSTKDGLKTYTWKVANLKAIKYEPYSPNSDEVLSTVKIAPESFKYEGITGNFTNWNQLGQWSYDKLLAGRQALPAGTVQQITTLTAGITDPKLKAKKIYEYMQGKTRYISVQIGIGGYQPFPASDVDNLNYGDCKALVNYTQALLKAANIDSWYCMVKSGSDRVSMLTDFASMNQADHAILCLPFKNDTTFVECTDQKMPFGFLDDFTDNRTVLACTPTGGKLINTTKYPSLQNTQQRNAAFVINAEGTLSGNVSTIFKGIQYGNHSELMDEPLAEQVKSLQRTYTAFNNLEVEKCTYKQDKKQLPAAIENLKIQSRDFATAENGRLYFSANPLNRTIHTIRDVRNRVNPVFIDHGYLDEDEITYMLPEGYRPDMAMLNIAVDKPFGKFKVSMAINGNKLIFKRILQVTEGTYEKGTYRDLVDFYQTVVDADNYNVTLVKN